MIAVAELAPASRGPNPTMKQPFRSANSRCPRKRGARGFTLIEVVAAFAILALGLAMTMQIAAGGLRQTRQAADYTEAALLAQTVLDTAGVGEKLEIGETSGDWEGGFSWTLTVSPYELADLGDIAAVDPLTSPVRLVELDLAVRWDRNGKQREAHYRSLRAMLPETL